MTVDEKAVPNDNETPGEGITELMRSMLGSDPAALDYNLAVQIVIALIKRLDHTLDLSELKSWKIVDDLEAGANELSAIVGRSIVLTKTEASAAIARVVHTDSGSIILIAASVFRKLVEGPDTEVHLSINLLHHELCHIHDAGVRKSILWYQGRVEGDIITMTMLPILIRLWDEYSANRRSTPTIPSWFEQAQAELLIDEWSRVRHAVVLLIKEYRLHGDMDSLLSAVASQLGHLFQLAGYIFGTAAGRNKTLEESVPEAFCILRESWLAPLMLAGPESLAMLYDSFGSWSDVSVFDDLAEVCRLVFEEAGLHISRFEDRLYIDVPFTPETMPADEDVETWDEQS
ncbi:MAG TPA: hypothetical protein VEC35_19915 [Noviherbaspirillum sp.]|nr:hypothetical protein [Noviherbaspirillum sp.]